MSAWTDSAFGLYDCSLNQMIRRAAGKRKIPLRIALISVFGSDGSIAMKEGHVPKAACLGFPLVRIRAASLNGGLDVVMLENTPDGDPGLSGGIPLSDGAGEVIAVGKGVTRFKVGDRVVGTFFERWIDGDRTRDVVASIRGGNAKGMLSEIIVSSEEGLVAIPDH